jgi:hypothetical protein
MHHIQRRLSPAILIAVIALFVALAGTAAAAVIIDSPDQLGPDVVTGPAIKNGSVQANDLSATAVAPHFSAKVRKDGTFVKGSRAVGATRTAKGTYLVRFNRPVRDCIFTATAREALAFPHVREGSPLETNTVVVQMAFLRNVTGGTQFESADNAFDLIGTC